MRLRKRLIDILEPSCSGNVIRDVRIGLGYTAVQLDDGRTGVAYTMGRNCFERLFGIWGQETDCRQTGHRTLAISPFRKFCGIRPRASGGTRFFNPFVTKWNLALKHV